ncbi:Phosphatidylinositol kinase [Leptomonas pyrrhocoris]|uniref:Phosphatidylinositol kinase n=1 Tax=Leptomonas pyrrhocoris TaxID=157538 RepID=A0A0M9G684_LEPPY|nr:Phosphatidylinositol kinase [Leptomonas pyrrhocoris]KPA83217.1 Phosphatidylinositol kinase [Leptomonas pyrrhocoris]|eukprot:XP_015661656.1 Phosphatidylinositol kinase [Leptomonas pyrrhocoris]
MSDHSVPSRSPELGARGEDATATNAASASHSPPPTTPTPLDAVWLGVYDRVSHTCFRVQIHDPLFLHILNNSVVPAAESDGALPFEMSEFVEYVDAYERERAHQQAAATARRNGTGSNGSFGWASGGIYSASSGLAGKGVGSDATAASATEHAPAHSSSLNSGLPLSTLVAGAAAAASPLKLEDALRQTLSDNSDFFFRLASVAYQLEPDLYGVRSYKAAQTLSSVAGGTGAGIRGGDNPANVKSVSREGVDAGGGAARGGSVVSPAPPASPRLLSPSSALAAGSLVSAAASGVSSMFANTLTAPAVPAPHHRNYAVNKGYSAAFHLCARLFALVYRDHCQALAEKISARFSALRVEDCVKYRKAVWTGFHLKAVDPYRSGARSESNLELRWVSENIKDDKHLFPDGGVVPYPQHPRQQHSPTSNMTRIVDATLSYVANARRRVRPGGASNSSTAGTTAGNRTKRDATGTSTASPHRETAGEGTAATENEIQTFGLTKLLHNPSWQKDEESSDTCPSCGRVFFSVGRPLGARAHHCRSCGVRLCIFCITKRVHYSFAKLTKPGSVDEAEERFVCDTCYREYEATRQLHYLGALFAFAGLGFSDLVLCRTVNEQWREAAELCISEYRLLLHNCDSDMHSVMTPVGILLQNSLFLLLGDGPTASVSVVHHPEAALLLLKFIATENLWMQDASYYFITRLSSSILNRADTVLTKLPSSSSAANASNEDKKRAFHLPVVPTLSHWHLFCTAFCSRISSSFFFVKCAELLCAAPVRVYDAYLARALERMTRLYLSTTPLWSRLASANRATEVAFLGSERQDGPPPPLPSSSSSSFTQSAAPLPLPTLSDVTEGQLVTIWLLDMLHKDALVPAPRRRYQQLLEHVIPTVATSSLSLVFIMLLSLKSTYSYYGYDEELFGLWRSRILAEVDRVDPAAKDRVVATLDFYAALDRFCAQSSAVNQVSVVEWIVRYCARGRAMTAPKPTEGGAAATTRAGHPNYADLPKPMLNPFKPYMVVRSIRLSGVRVALNAATKPIWLAFSTWTCAQHSACDETCRNDEAAAAKATATTLPSSVPPAATSTPPPSTALEAQAENSNATPTPPPSASPNTAAAAAAAAASVAQECMFLYKRENVERDQLMCISSRLLQMLLASEIGNAEMLDYSVLPLSCDSGLIEKAAGRELSSLDNMDITSYVLHRGQQGCINFLASAKLFLLLNYIFSIGDRHKGNVLIGSNGALLHIDFRFIFSEKTFVEKLARTTVRIDDAFLAAVEQCQLRPRAAAAATAAKEQAAAAGTGSPLFPRTRAFPPVSPRNAESNNVANTTLTATASTAAGAEAPPTPAELRADFFASAAEWFVHVRPFAAIFYELWLYAVHRHTVPYDEKELLAMLNTLFDRHASQSSSASKFSTTMRESVNVCRLKDVTHSSAEVLRGFTDQVSRRVSESGAGAVKMMGTMWTSWWTRGP